MSLLTDCILHCFSDNLFWYDYVSSPFNWENCKLKDEHPHGDGRRKDNYEMICREMGMLKNSIIYR